MKKRFGFFVIALLTGCGGGGGSDGAVQPVPPVTGSPVTGIPVTEPPVTEPPVAAPPETDVPDEIDVVDVTDPVTTPPADGVADAGPVIDAPVAVDDRFIIGHSASLISLDVLANDFDKAGLALQLENASAEQGVVYMDAGKLWYVPPPGFTGRDRLNYSLRNTAGRKSQAQVEVLVVADDGRTLELTWKNPETPMQIAGIVISRRNIDYPFLESLIRLAPEEEAMTSGSVFLTLAEVGRFEFRVAVVDPSGNQSAWSDAVSAEIYSF